MLTQHSMTMAPPINHAADISPTASLSQPTPPPISCANPTQGSQMKSNIFKLAIAALIGFAIIGGDMLASF